MLTRYGIATADDTHFYRFLLKLSLDPEPDWWKKFEEAKRVRFSLMNGTGFGNTLPKVNKLSHVAQEFKRRKTLGGAMTAWKVR